jgi:PAS domain S-box-containing protein
VKPPSIRRKLKAILMAVSALTVVVACGTFLGLNTYFIRRSSEEELRTLAAIVAGQAQAALAFDDAKAAAEILDPLRQKGDISGAEILTAGGRSFARFSGNDEATFEVRHDVVAGGQTLGAVVLRSNLLPFRERLNRNLLIAGLVVLLALLTSSILGARLQRLITGPILHLADTVRSVVERKDFTLRAVRTTRDETGFLIDGFNDMLAQIQVQDASLRRMRDDLEQRVKARTAELSRTNEVLEVEVAQRKRAMAELQQENTERRRAESALREAELRYRQLVQTVQAIVWRADARTFQFTFVSQEAENLLGYPVGQWLSEPQFWADHLHPEDRAWAPAHCMKAAGEGRAHEFAYRMVAADGRVVWLRDIVTVLMQDGKPREFIGVMVDITRQKDAEACMRESEERYRRLFESSPDAILIENEGTVVLMNPAAERLLGAENPEDLMEHGVFDATRRALQLASAPDAIPGSFEDTWRRLDGTPVEVEVTAIPFTHRGRNGSQILARDITKRKEGDRLKSEFISTVSHELRTPLTSIRGSLGLLAAGKAGPLPTVAKPLVDIANNDCQRLVRLINDLLDIQKIEAGRMEFRMKPLEIAALVERSIETNRSYGDQFGVRFAFEKSDRELRVQGDPDRLHQVLANLLSNAAKFSPKGGTVEVSVRRIDGSVRLAVRDHGPGIPEEFRKRIFQKFAQADSSDTRQKGGTGLGLSICKAIVERHQGIVGFDPAAGGGTVFWFEIPLLPAEAPLLA